MSWIHRPSKNPPPHGYHFNDCVILFAVIFVTAFATTSTASAGDLGLLAPNLSPPVTRAENDIVIDPLYYQSLCDYGNAPALFVMHFMGK